MCESAKFRQKGMKLFPYLDLHIGTSLLPHNLGVCAHWNARDIIGLYIPIYTYFRREFSRYILDELLPFFDKTT